MTGLDDDDYFLPERLTKLAERYDDKYAFVTDTPARLDKTHRTYPDTDDKRIIALQDILCENVVGNQVLTTKEKLLGVGGFSPEIKQQQDRDVWIKLILKYGPGIKLKNTMRTVSSILNIDSTCLKLLAVITCSSSCLFVGLNRLV